MKKSVNIAVIFPSRGLVFSRTAQELLENLSDCSHEVFFAHGLPIPDCFEKPLRRALKGSFSHIWLVEDDMILSKDTLKEMLEIDKAVVTANYPTTDRGDSSVLTIRNRVVYAGTGCTLIKREVFDELKPPYFRSDIVWIPKNRGSYIKFTAVKRTSDGYGYHDVNFFMNLYRLNIPVHVIKTVLGQRKLVELGKSGSNNGAHKITEWKKAKKDRYPTLIKNLPVEGETNLSSVVVNGKEILASKKHANKLIKQGLGTKPVNTGVVIDDSNI